MTELHELLRTDLNARDEYLWRVELHSELATSRLDVGRVDAGGRIGEDAESFATSLLPVTWERRSSLQSIVFATALLVLVAVAGGVWVRQTSRPELREPAIVARFAELNDSRWMTPATHVSPGDVIHQGQRIELSSGSAELRFNSGASLTMFGPTIIEPLADNSAFLLLGEAHLVAETPQSKGFTLVMQNSKFVDIGTAFTATVAPDGLSRLEVSEGEVDAVLEGTANTHRLRAGETLYVEPGKQKIITRIEPGDGTAAFHFPTIGPPSNTDYADQALGLATIRVAQGRLKNDPGCSGPATVLLDGKGQPHQDAPRRSAFFEDHTSGSFLVDLGKAISITRINSYSWHQHYDDSAHRHRAQQRFTLYGFAGDEVPDLGLPPEEAGWTRIARVNSDRFFKVNELLDRPAQQACSITAAEGDIGQFRYLLWEVKRNTFFGEIDVFGSPPDAAGSEEGE